MGTVAPLKLLLLGLNAELIRHLDLLRPIYQNTAAYGHFGRPEFSWENADKVDAVKAFFQG